MIEKGIGMIEKGYVQVYTGDGKGKTTAMLGLALRAAGAGLRVYIGQFIKSMEYSEITALKQYLPMVKTEQYGRGCFISRDASQEDIDAAREGFRKASEAVLSGEYDVVMLDEINIAVDYGMIPVGELIELIRRKPERVELVLTGRGAAREIVAAADLVSEMTEVKHYYAKGVIARDGIER
jgi:cob(I)alamin adenosyltransferase